MFISSRYLVVLLFFSCPSYICRIFKAAKSTLGPSAANLQLAKGEIVLDMDGANPVLPVLKHVGISAWPGELLERSLHIVILLILTFCIGIILYLKQKEKHENCGLSWLVSFSSQYLSSISFCR